MIKRLDHLTDLLQSKTRKTTLVLAVADEPNSMLAVYEAKQKNVVQPIFVGKEKAILKMASGLKIDLTGFEIVNVPDPFDAMEKAASIVSETDNAVIMKGNINTAHFLKTLLKREYRLKIKDVLSHFALFEVETYHKLIVVTDVAMNIAPNLKEKIGIVENSVECMRKLGISRPKVAVLGAVEMVNEKMQATLDAALLSKMNQRDQILNCLIDGPLAFDNAVSAISAKHKHIKSPVAGDTDILLMPDIEVGNVLYKSLVFFAKAEVAGIILGARVPVVLTSRSDSEASKLNSIYLACAVAG